MKINVIVVCLIELSLLVLQKSVEIESEVRIVRGMSIATAKRFFIYSLQVLAIQLGCTCNVGNSVHHAACNRIFVAYSITPCICRSSARVLDRGVAAVGLLLPHIFRALITFCATQLDEAVSLFVCHRLVKDYHLWKRSEVSFTSMMFDSKLICTSNYSPRALRPYIPLSQECPPEPVWVETEL